MSCKREIDEFRASKQVQYTTQLCETDVILGRGLSALKHPGNIFFRNVIKEKRVLYSSSCRRQFKKDVAQEVLSILLERNTRFVREVKSSDEKIEIGFSPDYNGKIWIIADEPTILQKIKQSLREIEQQDDGKQKVKINLPSLAAAAANRTTQELNPSYLLSNKADMLQNLTATQISDTTQRINLALDDYRINNDHRDNNNQLQLDDSLMRVNSNQVDSQMTQHPLLNLFRNQPAVNNPQLNSLDNTNRPSSIIPSIDVRLRSTTDNLNSSFYPPASIQQSPMSTVHDYETDQPKKVYKDFQNLV
jgi:hypothetical protein